MRSFLYDVILLGLIVFCIGGYVLYRNTAVQRLSKAGSIKELQRSPASKCTVNGGNFESSSVGTMFIRDGALAVDVRVTGPLYEFEGPLHVVISADGTHFIFPETSAVLPRTLDAVQRVLLIDRILVSYDWHCMPWWIPNTKVFQIPSL